MRIRDWSSDVCSSDLANVISLNTLHFGDSRVEKAVRQAERLLEMDIPLLSHGETGVGKEVFVKALHQASSRSKPVHCGQLRGNPRRAGGVGTVRLRKRRLHRRQSKRQIGRAHV